MHTNCLVNMWFSLDKHNLAKSQVLLYRATTGIAITLSGIGTIIKVLLASIERVCCFSSASPIAYGRKHETKPLLVIAKQNSFSKLVSKPVEDVILC